MLFDTSAIIAVRQGEAVAVKRFSELDALLSISIATRVELEGGAINDTARRAFLDALLRSALILPFDDACAAHYRIIIDAVGFSRPKVIDRMIAATALVHDLTLVTCNGRDFRDVPDLRLEVWPSLAA